MSIIRITKEFRFEMAHALMNYDGPCRNIHGHSYHLSVTVMGRVIENPALSENGMVMDFKDLKSIVKATILDVFDHSLVLNEVQTDIKGVATMDKVIFVPYQPTCENLLCEFVERIKEQLPSHLRLFSMKLRETETSYAEWYLQDNKHNHEPLPDSKIQRSWSKVYQLSNGSFVGFRNSFPATLAWVGKQKIYRNGKGRHQPVHTLTFL